LAASVSSGSDEAVAIQPGATGVARDPVAAVLDGDRPHHPVHRALGRRVRRAPGRGHERPGHGRDHDDAPVSADTIPGRTACVVWKAVMRCTSSWRLIVSGRARGRAGTGISTRTLREAGRVDEDVDRPGRLDELDRLLAVGEVGDVSRDLGARGAKLLRPLLDAPRGRRDRHARAKPRQQSRACKADPGFAAAAGDERGPAC
jgi:hypothetical protein